MCLLKTRNIKILRTSGSRLITLFFCLSVFTAGAVYSQPTAAGKAFDSLDKEEQSADTGGSFATTGYA